MGTMSRGSGGHPGTLVWVVGQARGLTWRCLGAQPWGWEPKSLTREAQAEMGWEVGAQWCEGPRSQDRPLLRRLDSDVLWQRG